ncbi:hypothetical protein BKA83DRAFT_4120839 [Pisolithus microcarpus]|nr:hypothetical protein BKA83DRAFT_4120839 [Pisolithus microcarpus]
MQIPMDTPFETDFGYASDTDAERAVDEDGDESGIGEEQPEGPFNLAELEILAHRRREWTQAQKKEKAIILQEIYKEFAKIGRNHDLSLAECQEKEEKITAWLKKPLRMWKPHITIQSAYKNAKKYALKFMKNFAEEMWRYCRMRMVSLTGWKDEDGAIQACRMDFNSNIASGSTFNNIHTLNAAWRDYLGTAYENPDIASGEDVPNMVAHHPRAKKGAPVELVTNKDGEIWIGDLIGHSCNTILQMVHGYLITQYWQACRRCSATVPFKKLGRYQAKMIASCHLPHNFSFTVDPSHMHLSAATELLNFWREQQITNPNDVFSFQKWLDQSGNLQEPSDGSFKPLEVARKRKCQSWEASTSTDGSTSDEDGDPDNEYGGTSSRLPLSNESTATSRVTSHPQKKTPMLRKVSRHTMDEDGQNPMDEEDLTLTATSVLEDTTEYPDSDGFESIPFADACTAKPGLLGQHQINGKLKSVLKQIPRSEVQNMDQQPESQKVIGDSSTRKPQPRKPAQKKGTISGAGNDQGLIGLPAAEGTMIEIHGLQTNHFHWLKIKVPSGNLPEPATPLYQQMPMCPPQKSRNHGRQ